MMAPSTGDNLYDIPVARLRIQDIPERQRPRELCSRMGTEHVPDDVLLALILRSGIHGLSVADLARELLSRYGSLTALSQVSETELATLPGMGPVKAQVLKAALELAKRLAEEAMQDGDVICTPEDAARVLRQRARTEEGEVFWVLPLDTKNRMKRPPIEVSRGVLDASLVHPREVFREAIRSSSAAVVLAHNHPSGDPQPSSDDIRITRQLVEAGKIVRISVLDHVVLGRLGAEDAVDYFSIREAGLVQFEV